MDCRKSLLLGLCLLGGAGCVNQPTVPGGSVAAMMGGGAQPTMREGKPKPSAETCVRYGQWCEGNARVANVGPVEKQKLRDEARQSYQRALKIDPAHKGSYLALASFYMANEDLERALAVCQNGVKRLPKEADLWSIQGICQCRKKDWAAAVESFRQAHALDPESHEHGVELGLCLARAGRIDESFACLMRLEGPGPAHLHVARMLEQVNRADLSKQHLRLALQVKPDLEPARAMLARLEGTAPPGSPGVVQVGCEQPAP